MTTYAQMPAFSLRNRTIQQIDADLVGARLELSTGTKTIILQNNESVPYQAVINRVFQLRPLSNPSIPIQSYLSVAKKIRAMAAVQERPGLVAFFFKVLCISSFSCCGCTASCREERIIQDSYSHEFDWLIYDQVDPAGFDP